MLVEINLKAADNRWYKHANLAGIEDKYAFIRKWRAMLSDELILCHPYGTYIEPDKNDIYLQKCNIVALEFIEEKK